MQGEYMGSCLAYTKPKLIITQKKRQARKQKVPQLRLESNAKVGIPFGVKTILQYVSV